MEREAALHFRNQFRQARALALRDAEAFDELIFVVERMGMFLTGSFGNLKTYKRKIAAEAERSSLASEVSPNSAQLHIPFSELYDLVNDGRNWAMHQGAFARHLTDHATRLAIVLEDALMNGNNKVRDFMVHNPVCAEIWHPLSFVRQRMLESSFSFLPLNLAERGLPPVWRLISDLEVARYLRVHERNARLPQRLDKASGDIAAEGPNCGRPIQFDKPHLCQPDDLVQVALERCNGLPVLVTQIDTGELLGILTAFDLL